MFMLDRKEVERIKKMYPKGTPIRLYEMAGESQMPFGTEGKVTGVDDTGQIHVAWETGSSLALNPVLDRFEIISLNEIMGRQKCQEFMDKVGEVIKDVDLARLDASCNSEQTDYASETLLAMHRAFEEVYGEGYVQEAYGMVMMPAIVREDDSGVYALSIVMLDLESSGEHWETRFLTPMGVLDQQSSELSDEQRAYLKKNFASYDYWYTPLVERDHHVDFASMPEQAANIRRKVDEWLVTGETEQTEGPQMDGPK